MSSLEKDAAVEALVRLLIDDEMSAPEKIVAWNHLYAFTVEHRVLITDVMWLDILEDPVIGPTISDKRAAARKTQGE